LFRHLVTIAPVSTVAVLSTAIVLVFAVAIQQSTEAGSAYKVVVKLDNVRWNTGYYVVTVNIQGVSQEKTVYTGSQTCPDDVGSLCYTNAGAFTFKSKFTKGSEIEVCAEKTTSTDNQCSYYETNGKKKQTVSVRVPDLNDDEQIYYNPNTGELENGNGEELTSVPMTGSMELVE
jgi:hypothetical protein